MTREQSDTANEIVHAMKNTQIRIGILKDMECCRTLELGHTTGSIVIRDDIKDKVIRLIIESEQKSLAKLEEALENV